MHSDDEENGRLVCLEDKNEELVAFGITIALLIIDGDPRACLANLSTNGEMTDWFFHSRSVRNGFSRVLNPVAFETLFDPTDMTPVFDLIRQITPLKI